MKNIITTECVSWGHPDKIADFISDAILDEILMQDKNARCGIEVMVKDNVVVLGGEIKTSAVVNYDTIVRDCYRLINFPINHNLQPQNIRIVNLLGTQSHEISNGINISDNIIGAGDQGFCVGFASNETDSYMPLGCVMSRQIINGLTNYCDFGPDMKTQVLIDYSNSEPAIKNILVSTMHNGISLNEVKTVVQDLIRNDTHIFDADIYDKYIKNKNFDIHVNPCGEWHIGGPLSDCGVTGRKLVVDSYGGYCNIGGGNMHGKDLSKIDRSGAYMARCIAKNIVAAGLANTAKVTLTYEIAVPEPTNISIELDEKHNNPALVEKLIKFVENLNLTPKVLINSFAGLDLTKGLNNHVQEQTYKFSNMFHLNCGHFGNYFFPWEHLDFVEQLKNL